jgi:sec-independent protein translocase protein TatC
MATHVEHERIIDDVPFDDSSLEDEPIGAQMTLVEHLTELRRRLFICVIAILVTTVGAFFLRGQLMAFLRLPLVGVYKQLVTTGIGEPLTVVFKISLGVGLALAAPIWLWQTWGFIAPALTRHERKYALPFTLIGVGLFILGLAVGFLTLRFPVDWLISFGQDSGFRELISADSYFSFVTFFMLAFGVTFELPLVLTFLSVLGVLSSQKLRKNRPYVLVGLWVTATIVTPGADPYSPIILGTALTFLYFFSEILIRVIGK